ncbi:unnamed protein product [Cunninghamella blakesleeana]
MKHSIFYKIILISTLFTAITKANFEEEGDDDDARDLPYYPYRYPDYMYPDPIVDYISPQLTDMYPSRPPPPMRRPIRPLAPPPPNSGLRSTYKNNIRPPPPFRPQSNPVNFDASRVSVPMPDYANKNSKDDSLGGVSDILSKATTQVSGLLNQ